MGFAQVDLTRPGSEPKTLRAVDKDMMKTWGITPTPSASKYVPPP